MEENKEQKSDKITSEEANKTRLLIKEDMAKLRLAREQALGQVQMLNARIAECELGLADLDRREAGVMYPEVKKPEPKPAMKEPVGPDADGKGAEAK